MKTAIITDIHGCYWTLKRLLARIPKEYQVVFGGDLIDRGPNSHLVVAHAMKNNVPTVMGNHEHLMLDHYGALSRRFYQDGCWEQNGGDKTIKAFNNAIPGEVIRWMKDLPVSLEWEDLRVSHTGYGPTADELAAIWYRFGDDGMYLSNDGRFQVFGHTQDRWPIIGENFARIDTGCAYTHQGFGFLTAFLWPERVVIMQPYNEDPVKE